MSQHHRRIRLDPTGRKYLYRKIYQRDNSICRLCKKNNDQLLTAFKALKEINDVDGMDALALIHKISMSRLKDALKSKFGRLWDYDHIQRLEHYGENHINNIRTLCVSCHLNINRIHYYLNNKKQIPEHLLEFYTKYKEHLR